jgi:hypothetical protein
MPSDANVLPLTWQAPAPIGDDEHDALELARRVGASDVGQETLTRLEAVVDELAIAYTKTPPALLLGRVRRHLGYVNRLLDARKTLGEHRRLLVIGGWLSLLGATVHIDVKQYEAAAARLKTAASLAPPCREPRHSRLVLRDRRLAGAHRGRLLAGPGTLAGRASHCANRQFGDHSGYRARGSSLGAAQPAEGDLRRDRTSAPARRADGTA